VSGGGGVVSGAGFGGRGIVGGGGWGGGGWGGGEGDGSDILGCGWRGGGRGGGATVVGLFAAGLLGGAGAWERGGGVGFALFGGWVGHCVRFDHVQGGL